MGACIALSENTLMGEGSPEVRSEVRFQKHQHVQGTDDTVSLFTAYGRLEGLLHVLTTLPVAGVFSLSIKHNEVHIHGMLTYFSSSKFPQINSLLEDIESAANTIATRYTKQGVHVIGRVQQDINIS